MSGLALGLGLGVAGAVLLVLGWWGVSGESLVALQLPYLASASIPGAALVVAGAVLLTGTIRRPPADPRVDALMALLTEGSPAADVSPGPATTVGDEAAARWVTVAGASHYHRADCALVAGKPAEPVGRGAVGALSACPICRPGP